MPVSINSRYAPRDAYPAAAADGTVRPTLPIRRTPAATGGTYRHRATGCEDLEYLSWRYLRASEAWWLLADVNPVAFPLDVGPGAVLEVPLGERLDRTDRTRVF